MPGLACEPEPLTEIRSIAFWSRLFYDLCENGRGARFLIVFTWFILRPLQARLSLPAHDADQSSVKRILVATIFDTCENGRMMPLLIVAKGFIIRPVRASRHCPLVKSTIVRRGAIRSRPSSGAWNSRCSRMLAEVRGDLVEFHAGRVVRGSTWSRGRPESAASHSGRDHSATHERMVRRHPCALSPNDLFSDRSELGSGALPSRPEFAKRQSGRNRIEIRSKPFGIRRTLPTPLRSPRLAMPRLVGEPEPLTGIRSIAFWSRLFYDTCENGRMMPLLIAAKGFIIRPVRASRRCPLVRPTIARPVAIQSRPSRGAWNSCRARIPAEVRGDLWLNAVPDGSAAVPLGRGADRNPQHRILVATILRRMREWSDGAPPRCRQTICSLTGPSPCGIACS